MTISEVPAQSSTASLKEIEEAERNQGISGSARSKVHAHEYLETTKDEVCSSAPVSTNVELTSYRLRAMPR